MNRLTETIDFLENWTKEIDADNKTSKREQDAAKFMTEWIDELNNSTKKRRKIDPNSLIQSILGKTYEKAEMFVKQNYPEYSLQKWIVDGKMYAGIRNVNPNRLNIILRKGIIIESEHYLGRLCTSYLG